MHYVTTEPRHRAAIISRVIDVVEGLVDLQVFETAYRDGSRGISHVMFDPRFTIGTWHFIEEEE